MTDNLVKCEKALGQLAEFLKNHHPIFNVCMVDFITKDIFQHVLNFDIGENLLQLSDTDLLRLPTRMINNNVDEESNITNGLDALIQEMSAMTLEGLHVTTSKEQLLLSSSYDTILSHFDQFMSQKKMHEVLMMSETVSEVCRLQNITCLVDVGSGKAYLSQVMAAMQKEMAILAIDAQSGNLKGAQKRSANLEVRT